MPTTAVSRQFLVLMVLFYLCATADGAFIPGLPRAEVGGALGRGHDSIDEQRSSLLGQTNWTGITTDHMHIIFIDTHHKVLYTYQDEIVDQDKLHGYADDGWFWTAHGSGAGWRTKWAWLLTIILHWACVLLGWRAPGCGVDGRRAGAEIVVGCRWIGTRRHGVARGSIDRALRTAHGMNAGHVAPRGWGTQWAAVPRASAGLIPWTSTGARGQWRATSPEAEARPTWNLTRKKANAWSARRATTAAAPARPAGESRQCVRRSWRVALVVALVLSTAISRRFTGLPTPSSRAAGSCYFLADRPWGWAAGGGGINMIQVLSATVPGSIDVRRSHSSLPTVDGILVGWSPRPLTASPCSWHYATMRPARVAVAGCGSGGSCTGDVWNGVAEVGRLTDQCGRHLRPLVTELSSRDPTAIQPCWAATYARGHGSPRGGVGAVSPRAAAVAFHPLRPGLHGSGERCDGGTLTAVRSYSTPSRQPWRATVAAYISSADLGGNVGGADRDMLADRSSFWTAVDARIGEASNPGPGWLDNFAQADDELNGNADGDIRLANAIKTARHRLAEALARAKSGATSARPIFADQSRDDARPPKQKRARIQAPLAERAVTQTRQQPTHQQQQQQHRQHREQSPTGNGEGIPRWRGDQLLDTSFGNGQQRAVGTGPLSSALPNPVGNGLPYQHDARRPRGGRHSARGCRAGRRVRRGRVGTASAAAARGRFDIFMGNVSVWGDKSAGHVLGLDADALLIAETHAKIGSSREVLGALGRSGWNATMGPAQQSCRSERGSNGGVLAAVHNRWHSSPWATTADSKGRIGPYHDLVGRTISLAETEVNLMVAYFDCYEGLEGANLCILEHVEAITGMGRDVFVLGADFNLPPEELEEKAGEWLRRNRATIVKPSNLTVTCRASVKGSLIDFFIVSERIAGLVTECRVDVAVPWWPHYGLWLTLGSEPTRVLARQWESRPSVHLRRAGTTRHNTDTDDGNADGDNAEAVIQLQRMPHRMAEQIWAVAWDLAREQAPTDDTTDYELQCVDKEPEDAAITNYIDECNMTDVSNRLGQQYTTWRHAVHVYTKIADDMGYDVGAGHKGAKDHDSNGGDAADTSAGLDKRFEASLVEAPGRPAAYPRVVRKPILPKTSHVCREGLAGLSAGGGGPVEVRILRVLRGWFRSIGRWAQSGGVADNRTGVYVLFMAALTVCGHTAAARQTWDHMEQGDAEALRNLALATIVGVWKNQRVDVAEVIRRIDDQLKKAVASISARRRKAFEEWLARALEGGAKAAHRFINQDAKAPPLALILPRVVDGVNVLVSDPDAVAELHAAPWKRIWGCDRAADARNEVAHIRNRRESMKDDAEEYSDGLNFAPEAIRSACNSFRRDTAIGVDPVTFTSIASLPDVALRSLGDLLREAVANLSLPSCTLLNVLNLLGKKLGGSRTIATMSTFYRILMRLCGDDVSDWDTSTAGKWDTAVAGSSALRAHLVRALEVEIALIEGLSVSYMFVGCGKALRFNRSREAPA